MVEFLCFQLVNGLGLKSEDGLAFADTAEGDGEEPEPVFPARLAFSPRKDSKPHCLRLGRTAASGVLGAGMSGFPDKTERPTRTF